MRFLNEVKNVIQVTNQDHEVVIKIFYLYYDMKLTTFGMNDEMN